MITELQPNQNEREHKQHNQPASQPVLDSELML